MKCDPQVPDRDCPERIGPHGAYMHGCGAPPPLPGVEEYLAELEAARVPWAFDELFKEPE